MTDKKQKKRTQSKTAITQMVKTKNQTRIDLAGLIASGIGEYANYDTVVKISVGVADAIIKECEKVVESE